MIFKRKNSGEECPNCKKIVEKNYSFCPFCGVSLFDAEREKKDFGLLGRSDDFDLLDEEFRLQGFGMFEKIFQNVFNNFMKDFEGEFKREAIDPTKQNEKIENIRVFPNAIKIKIRGPARRAPQNQQPRVQRRTINESQLQKINSLPREKAKSAIKRFGDRLIYEIVAPGVESVNDIFISKLESGYEIKAIGKKKIYVNNIPVNLPMTKYSIRNNKIFVEFNEGV